MPKDLPIGVQTFEKIIEGNYVYVDKTQHIYNLITGGSVYFLSRPRRFGKSLLISTLDSIFKGKKELFKGLWIEQANYDWQEYPVIRIDMSKVAAKTAEGIRGDLIDRLSVVADQYGVAIDTAQTEYKIFEDLIKKLSSKGKVVILIDEYDKPLISNLRNNEEVSKIRDILRNFYGIIKASDEYIRFVLLTGVSKFSKVSVFSGLNNLNDISMDIKYSTLLGYTQDELESNFAEYIDELSQRNGNVREENLKEIKRWYNGYRFSSNVENLVYNPFSTLLLFDKYEYSNHWFATATPTFLIDLLKEKASLDLQDLDGKEAEEEDFSTYDVEDLSLLPLLVQSGYMTIKDVREEYGARIYKLAYPNEEVRRSFLNSIAKSYSNIESVGSSSLGRLQSSLEAEDLSEYFEALEIFFAEIPYDIQIRNKERYYQTIFYVIHQLLGYRIKVEARTNRGRIDSVIELADKIYIFEFKLNDTKEAALEQIKTKKYYEPYQGKNKKLILVGAEFNIDDRNIVGYLEEVI